MSWSILIGMSILAVKRPLIAAVVMIAFYIYWLLKLIYMNIFLVISYLRLSVEEQTDWIAQAKGVKHLDSYLKEIKSKKPVKSFKRFISHFAHYQEVVDLKKSNAAIPSLEDIYQLIIMPVVSEAQDIIEPGIESFFKGHFPAKRILVVMALEERASEEAKKGVYAVQKRYKEKFLDFLVVVHPNGLHGEARVKGANATYAGREAARYLKRKGIPFENVISSCFDADTVVSPNYFSCVSYYYIITPDREHASFQPIPVYHNNIWQAPGFARVLDIGSSFFQLIESTNPEKLVTFSSHSMSFKALVDIDYWPVDMISDDSAIYWKALIHYDSHYRVVPMYVTLSMDVTEAENWWKTAVNVYKQKRRWAWGAENLPIVFRAFLKLKGISKLKKISLGFKLLEGHLAWSTWSFLLTIIGWLPAIFATKKYSESIFYYSAPRIAGMIFTLASVGLVVCILLSLLLLPKKKVKHNILKRVVHAFEWLLVPVISVFFSALPALDAQTRLMLGKYMEFWVTVKKRK
ncbi:MAG: glycosyltransferase family 2 protein [Candidatus Omnitrophica bacterium]|nr:glycosyltransferase family 2 protein [Candidatus Omnitrophota bacterium]